MISGCYRKRALRLLLPFVCRWETPRIHSLRSFLVSSEGWCGIPLGRNSLVALPTPLCSQVSAKIRRKPDVPPTKGNHLDILTARICRGGSERVSIGCREPCVA